MAESVAGTDWSSAELDAIVADYFDMLRQEQTASRPNKTAHRRALMEQVHRSSSSIEFKHQNISAVLTQLGLPRIEGYRPAWNFRGRDCRCNLAFPQEGARSGTLLIDLLGRLFGILSPLR